MVTAGTPVTRWTVVRQCRPGLLTLAELRQKVVSELITVYSTVTGRVLQRKLPRKSCTDLCTTARRAILRLKVVNLAPEGRLLRTSRQVILRKPERPVSRLTGQL